MKLFQTAYRNFFLPLYAPERYTNLRSHWRELERLENEPVERNRERQFEKVKKVIDHAYRTTPFYKKRFDDSGVTPGSIQSPADLKKLPLLTRDDMRLGLDEMRSSSFPAASLQQSHTGGTTDTPVTVLRSPDSIRFRTAAQLRFHAWAGFYPGDKALWLWGAAQDFSGAPSWRWRTFERVVLRRTWAYAAQLNENILEQHRQLLNDFCPKVIISYPTPLALLCEFLEQTGRSFHPPGAALVTAEPLLAEQRASIRRVMGIDPFVQYGTRDFGMPAAQCEKHDGLHINPECVFIEFLPIDPSDPNGIQEMVVTDLTNLAMPLIRYKINDCGSAIASACGCGRGYPLMTTVVGRTTDNFYLADGTVIAGVTLPGRILKVCPGIAKMQVIQETFRGFKVRYVPGDGFTDQNLETIRANFRHYVGDVEIEFDRVSAIPREPSGKTRLFISRVDRARAAKDVTA
jgi:phenylacetate-CoA ligase